MVLSPGSSAGPLALPLPAKLQLLHTPEHAPGAVVAGLELVRTNTDLLTDLQSSFVGRERADFPSGIQEKQAATLVRSEPDDPTSVRKPSQRLNRLHGLRIAAADPLKRQLDPALLGLMDPGPRPSFEVFADANPATAPHLLALAQSLEYGATTHTRWELSDAGEDLIHPSELV